MDILRGMCLAIKRRKDAKSDNIAVKAQALYESECEEWGISSISVRNGLPWGGLVGFVLYGCNLGCVFPLNSNCIISPEVLYF